MRYGKVLDLINRKDAIEAVRKAYFDKNIQSARKDPCIVDAVTDWAIRQIKMLPAYVIKEDKMTKYDYELQVEELLDSALNELSPKAYAELMDSIRFMVDDRKEDANGSIGSD